MSKEPLEICQNNEKSRNKYLEASVFAIIPHGRHAVRSLVASTDCRHCLHDLTPPTEKRDTPWRPLARHQAGNLFGFLLTKDGKPCQQAGECCGASPGLAASLTIQRTRSPRAPPATGPAGELPEAEGLNEVFVPGELSCTSTK